MGKATTILAALRRPSEARALVNYTVWRDPLHRIEDNPESGWDREEMKQCWGLLDATSRSFAAVIKELEGDLSRVIALFYLILRGLDTIEDDMTLDIDAKVPLLVNFHERLEQDGWNFTESGPNEKDRALLVDFQVVIAEYKRLGPDSPHLTSSYKKAIADITQKMGAGMARYAKVHAESGGRFSVDTLASFDLYCHFVAGLVGEGLSRLFSASGKEAPELGEQVSLSNSMGLLLQKTNILRDFREDTDEGRVFWPAELWSKYADKPEDLYAHGNEQKALWALSEMTVDALSHATDALDYLTLLSNQSVFNFCAIPQAMAMATLQECFMNPKVFHQNVKIRKGLAVRLILDATNPRDVAYMFRDMARAIHAKAVANDPSFIKIAVLCGRIEQWTETRYPSFIELGKPVPKSMEDWRPGMDSRVRQLAPTEAILAERRERAAAMEATKMSNDDYKFLALLLGGIVLLFLVLAAIGGGMMWWLFFRDGARFAEDVLGDPEEVAARVKEILHPEF
ncbi:BZ3500_MvSof-1268-A1-R1_Chr1-3g01900 [Microbotryum saponariae]|uniref:Squalene synthase n=1 Tax=Microbotryum saponariae TaxID=289078 RepID=A0A2X0KD47_9BASI|nr:BZ3500_MvSof-1268-A1-R1_Chr1-3g01900 [Microbotryum saponariae]SCZ94853.1 BZ3501_MvSof-1269-A2-R1_Chr1-3g01502 [Microbotryum saponariae]